MEGSKENEAGIFENDKIVGELLFLKSFSGMRVTIMSVKFWEEKNSIKMKENK